MRRATFAALLVLVVASALLSACAPVPPKVSGGPVPLDARTFYVGGYVTRDRLDIHARVDVTISAVGGQTDPGTQGFGGIPDGPVSSPWERHFAIMRSYDKPVTVNLTLTYIAPAAQPDELTCYIATGSLADMGHGPLWQATVLDMLTVRARSNRTGSSVIHAYCVALITPLQN